MEVKRLLALSALGLAALIAVVLAREDTAPFPISPGTAVRMAYEVTPFDSANYTVTDSGAVRAVIDCLNAMERTGPDQGRDAASI